MTVSTKVKFVFELSAKEFRNLRKAIKDSGHVSLLKLVDESAAKNSKMLEQVLESLLERVDNEA